MATSGTVGQTVFTTQEVIDHAYRRTKIPPELIGGEQIDSALRLLWTFLQGLASKGAPVWKIQTVLLPLYQGQGVVPTPVGTIEVLKANLRTLQRLSGIYSTDQGGDPDLAFDSDPQTACTQVAPNGSIEIDLGSANTITTIGLLPNATGSWNFVYEISQDGVSWENVATFTAQAVVTRQWLWNDYAITRFPSYQYARIRATTGTMLDVAEFVVANTPSAIPMGPLNKDDWFNLPNKAFQGRPVNHWQNMVLGAPVLNIWPVPDFAANFYQIEAQIHQAIQDVGTMAQQLEIPDRWFEAVVWSLAEMVADDNPDYKGGLEGVARLERKAKEALNIAWGGIQPKGPIYLQPNISGYTRG